MKKRVLDIGALALASVIAVWYADHVPDVVPALAPAADFSAERALEHVRRIAQRPHPTGSEDHGRVRDYVVQQVAALGIEPVVQATTGVGTRYAVAGRVQNILARIPGRTAGGPSVLLMAHYDGVPAGPAAGDDASGTAVLLETLRALRASAPLEHDVIALFTDAEETGLLGAAAFVREHPWARDVEVILNFEARGVKGPSLMFETGAGNRDVVSMLRRAPDARATSLSTAVYRQLPNDTDLSEMGPLDKPAMNFAFIGGVDRYHTSEDDVAHLSAGSVQHHGDQALALARAFGSGPLPRPGTADAVFFDLPIAGLVIYSYSIAVIVAIVALALCVFACVVLVRRREGRAIRDVVLGAVGMVLSVAMAAVVAGVVVSLLGRAHGAMEWGGMVARSGVYAVAVALLAIAVVLAFMALVRRVAGFAGMATGALLVLALLNLWISVAMPGVSFLIGIPVLLVSVAAAVRGAGWRAAAIGAHWLACAITIFLLVPTGYLMVCVALGLDLAGAIILAVLASVGTWLLAPCFDADGRKERWILPSAFAAVALVLVVAGLATVRTNVGRPAGYSRVYAVDADRPGSAWLTGGATSVDARRWLRSSNAALGSPATDAPVWLRRSYDATGIIAVPPVAMPSMSANVSLDSMGAGTRTVTVRLRAPAGARSVAFSIDSGIVVDAAVDGRPIDRTRYRSQGRRWTLEYVAPGEEGIALQLTLRGDAPVTLTTIARIPGLPDIPGVTLPFAPAGVIPIQSGDMTLLHATVVIGR